MVRNVNEALLGKDMFGDIIKPDAKGKLREKFLIPPFSVLNAREGPWQARKRQWIALGMKSELGRGDNILGHSDQSINIDFYSLKRKLEEELGRETTTDEARAILDERGLIKVVSKKANAIPGGGANILDRPGYKESLDENRGGNGPDLMKGENSNFGKEKQHNFVNVVLMNSDSGNDPAYYFKKQAKEKELGRELSTEEFQRDYYEGPDSYASGTSIFDPTLTELMYSWFCPDGGMILDPFAGGSVRGIVAAVMGYRYYGIELSGRQVEANIKQAEIICPDNEIRWVPGDALEKLPEASYADFLFTCPPYGDLEVYSDDPADLSTMPYPRFIAALHKIIELACAKLKQDRLACIVVGDFRDKKGYYNNFVSDTIKGFLDAGLKLYNEIILVTAVGSLPIRITRQFEAGRKIGKTHQNVLVFKKP